MDGAGGGQGGDGLVVIELVDAPGTGQASLPAIAATTKAGPTAPALITAAPPLPENPQDIQAPPRSTGRQVPPATSIKPPPQAPSDTSPLQGQPEIKSPEKVATSTPPPPSPAPKPESSPPPKPLVPPKSPTDPVRSGQELSAPPPVPNAPKVGSDPIRVAVQPIVNPEPVVSQELRLTIVSLRPVQNRDALTPKSDNPDRFAQVVSPSASFPEMSAIPSCVRGSLGKPVALRLTIGADGVPRTSNPSPSQSSSCTIDDVSKFAEDLVRKKIQFRPAQSGGSPVESTVEIDVKLSLV